MTMGLMLGVVGGCGEKIPDGKFVDYFESGRIKLEGILKDGKRDGKWVEYYEDGQIREEGNYNEGDGKWVYFEGGRIRSEGYYKDKHWHGKVVWYYQSGEIENSTYFNEGVQMGNQLGITRMDRLVVNRTSRTENQMASGLGITRVGR